MRTLGSTPGAGAARRRPAPALRVSAAAGLVTVGLAVLAPPASAHAGLLDAEPRAASVVRRPPEQVSLTYSDQLREPAYVVVTDPDGARVDAGAVEVDRNVVAVGVMISEPGTYRVASRVVSADGHPVSATYSFAYRRATPGTTLEAITDEGAAGPGRAADLPSSGSGKPAAELATGVGVAGLVAGFLLLRRRGRS